MSDHQSDAFVFFGATGDLAYKQIFPALQAMAKRSHLDVPIIGVTKAGWTLDQFRARARDSVEQHGGLDAAALRGSCPVFCAMSTATIGTQRRSAPFGNSSGPRRARRTISR